MITTTPIKAGSAASLHHHFLSRTTLGVTPESLHEITTIGIKDYLKQQLQPESLDDSATDLLVSRFEYLNQDTHTLISNLKVKKTASKYRHHLSGATVIRAARSKRQLQELMVDFWSNHFSVDTSKKKQILAYKIAEDRQFRKLALGRFSDLLMASAKSPAMLLYLGNAKSKANKRRIPNENYARELMELHTLGVDGGYDEQDVLEVSYVLSGWGIGRDRQFLFRKHLNRLGPLNEGGDVLGWTPVAPERSLENGESLLNFLAHHPSTARFISWKLCRHFISDHITQDAPVVTEASEVFLQQDGNIAAILETILLSSEFNVSIGQKVKRPNEFFYALLRSSQAQFDLSTPEQAVQLGRYCYKQLKLQGQALFEAEPPTGYSDIAGEFINTDTMIKRWNLAFALINRKKNPLFINSNLWYENPLNMLDLIQQIAGSLLGYVISDSEIAVLLEQTFGKSAADPVESSDLEKIPALATLLLCSAHFQIR